MQGSQITQQLKPVYLLASAEPLLTRDWLDEARSALRSAGFEDILNLQADTGFDWQGLLEEGDMMSLFSNCKCRIVTLPNGKPGQQGSKAILGLCGNPGEGNVYIFVTPQLDRQGRNSSWCKAIQSSGEIVELKPVYDNQLADWLLQRARSKGLTIDAQSAQFLAECTEGNLLAADQELEKLSIRFVDQGLIDFETIEDSVAQSARYSRRATVTSCWSTPVSPAEPVAHSRYLIACALKAMQPPSYAGRCKVRLSNWIGSSWPSAAVHWVIVSGRSYAYGVIVTKLCYIRSPRKRAAGQRVSGPGLVPDQVAGSRF